MDTSNDLTVRSFSTIHTADSADNLKATIEKQKRPRRSYKSEYDALRNENGKLRIYAIAGWALFFTTVLVVVVVQLSEI